MRRLLFVLILAFVLAAAAMAPSLAKSTQGAKNQCEKVHHGTFIDLDGLAYLCLGPS